MTETPESIDFEAAPTELEGLVERMEAGALTLEESLAAFERGVKLTRICQTALTEAELKVKKLMQDGTEIETDLAEAND